MSFLTSFKKPKCIKCFSDKFASKSKLDAQDQNGKYFAVFHETIKKTSQKYPTTFSNLNYSIKKYSLKSTKYSVSYGGPTLWNKIPGKRD